MKKRPTLSSEDIVRLVQWRRTAELVLGDPSSEEYLKLKDYRWNNETQKMEGSQANRAAWGWTSNNSVNVGIGQDYTKLAAQTAKNGEPGYVWMDNCRDFHRMDGKVTRGDLRAVGTNPCAEQTLESYELCCLVETFPTKADDLQDYLRTLKFAYLYAKTVTLAQTHWAETNRVMLRNRRIGTSMSGIAQFLDQKGIQELERWCEVGYQVIQDWDYTYSEWLCVPKSVKTTSVKPSGTVSLLPGVTPGIHFPESNYYIRRMRIAKDSQLVDKCIEAGYHVEDSVDDPKYTSVVSIPVYIEGVRTINDVGIWEQTSLAAFMQEHWADNQVSVTVTFKKDEGSQIKPILDYFQYKLKSISFLPKLESTTAYPQMPYEEISKDRYEEMSSKITELNFDLNEKGEDVVAEKFCDGDSCTF